MQVDIKLVRQLAELLNETGLTEIEVEDDDRKIRVARTLQAASVAVAAPAPVAAPAAAPVAAPVAPTAPAEGLCLRRIDYPSAFALPDPV